MYFFKVVIQYTPDEGEDGKSKPYSREFLVQGVDIYDALMTARKEFGSDIEEYRVKSLTETNVSEVSQVPKKA